MWMQATLAGRPGAAYVDIPSNILFAALPADSTPQLPPPPPPRQRLQASSAAIEQAVALLKSAQRCVLLCACDCVVGSVDLQAAGVCSADALAAVMQLHTVTSLEFCVLTTSVPDTLSTALTSHHSDDQVHQNRSTSMSMVAASFRCASLHAIAALLPYILARCLGFQLRGQVAGRWWSLARAPSHIDSCGHDTDVTCCRPLVVIGKGAALSQADAALRLLVDATGLPFLATAMGRGVVPDGHPGAVNAARSAALRDADVAIIFGGR